MFYLFIYSFFFLIDKVLTFYQNTGFFDDELVSHLPESLKFVSQYVTMWSKIYILEYIYMYLFFIFSTLKLSSCGAGYDQVSVPALNKRGIKLSNTPGAVVDGTADCGIFLLIGAMRNFNQGMANVRKGIFRGNLDIGHDPTGKVLGILGMGDIGKAMATRAASLGMKIQYHNRRKLTPMNERLGTFVDFDTLLSTSDVLSLNLPLVPETRHIIGAKEFAKMKDGIVIVNTARGAVMDEAALVDALNSGKVRSAGLDVYEKEPEVHPGLLNNEHVLLVPHMGTHTYETQYAMEILTIENIRSAITKGHLKTPVN